MKKILVVSLLLSLCASGCSLFGGQEEPAPAKPVAESPAAPESVAAPAPEQSPVAAQSMKKSGASQKKAGKKRGKMPAVSQEQAAAELQPVARSLVGHAASSVVPNERKREIVKEGKEYVARYLCIDPASMTTEVRPSTHSGSQYVGFIRYIEDQYECRGKTRQEAMQGQGKKVRSRRINEMICYTTQWQNGCTF